MLNAVKGSRQLYEKVLAVDRKNQTKTGPVRAEKRKVLSELTALQRKRGAIAQQGKQK